MTDTALTYSIDLDWALDDSAKSGRTFELSQQELGLEADIAAFAARHTVTATVVTEAGPTGWPVVQLTGTIDQLADAFMEYNGDEDRANAEFDVRELAEPTA